MIDRSSAVPLLRPRYLLICAGTSAAIFVLLPLISGLCWAAAAISFVGCWLGYLLLLILGYGLLLAVVVGIGWLAIAVNSNAKNDDAKKGAGCVGCGMVLLALFILSKGWPWVGSLLVEPKAVLEKSANTSWNVCEKAARFVWNDAFLHYDVYLWSWVVLAIALSLAALTLLTVLLVNTEGSIKRMFGRVRFKCPGCGSEKPVFRCRNTNCSETHDDLRPTVYGVFRASCHRCAQSLPTLDLFGRLGLEKVCGNPNCNRDQLGHAFGRASEFHFAIVGAQSSGKSNYMVAVVRALVEDYCPNNGTASEFTDIRQRQEYDGYVRGFQSGRPVPKTASTERSLAFNLALTPRDGMRCLLYLYDAAGEDFEAGDIGQGTHGMVRQDYHRYIDGIVFVIDPFAEAMLQSKHSAGKGDNPARYDAFYMLGRLLPFWERSLNASADSRMPVPVAVVVTKADACGLESTLKGLDLCGAYPSVDRAVEMASQDSGAVRQFLLDSGAGDAIRTLESRFSKVRYFGVSALGRGADPANRSPFLPRRVLGPLLWLCHHTRALTDGWATTQAAGHAFDFVLRCVGGREGGFVRVATWAVLLSAVFGAFYGAWVWLGLWPAICFLALSILLPLVLLRYHSNGTKDLANLTEALAAGRQWYLDAIKGARSRRDQRRALVVLVLALSTLSGLTYLWWPLGIVGLLLLLVAWGLSQLAS